MTLAANKQLVLSLFNAIAAGDFDRVREMTTDDATWWVIPSTPVSGLHRKQDFLELFKQVLALGDGPLTYQFDELTAEDNRVSVTMKGHMKLRNGKVFTGDYHFLVFIQDGKVAAAKEFVDSAHVRDVMGGEVVGITQITA